MTEKEKGRNEKWVYFLEKIGGYDKKIVCPLPDETARNWITSGHCRLATDGEIETAQKAWEERYKKKATFELGKAIETITDNQQEVMSLLDEDEVQQAYLDQGYSSEHDVFWYGFTLAGKDAIVLSDRTVLRNTIEKFKDKQIGENEIASIFDYRCSIGDIAPQIRKETVKEFLTKGGNVNPREIYKQVRDKILYYMDFSGKDEMADVFACWVMATYWYSLFWWFPHILINAPSGSGKSKCAYILSQLSFRGFDLGASAGVTPAQVFRTLEGNRGTIVIDEYEQSTYETQKIVNQIINASATKDAYVIRNEQINKKWVVWKFPIYSPKIVCNISGINPTSLSRFIAFKWLRTTDKEKGSRKPHREKDRRAFLPIRESLYLLGLSKWKELMEIYDTIDIPQLKDREEDNWLPLFSVARLVDNSNSSGDNVNAEKQILKYVESYKELDVETGDYTGDMFSIIFENVGDEPMYYSPKQISEFEGIDALLGHYKNPANFIGRKLKMYQFKQYRIRGSRKYLLSKENIKKIIDMYFSTEQMTPNDTIDNNDNNVKNVTSDTSLGVNGGVLVNIDSSIRENKPKIHHMEKDEYSWNPPAPGSSDEDLRHWIHGVQHVIANLSDDKAVEMAVQAGWKVSKVRKLIEQTNKVATIG